MTNCSGGKVGGLGKGSNWLGQVVLNGYTVLSKYTLSGNTKGAFSYRKCFLVFHFQFSRKWKGFSISRKQIKILKTRSKLEMLFSFSILENLNTCWRCGKRGKEEMENENGKQ